MSFTIVRILLLPLPGTNYSRVSGPERRRGLDMYACLAIVAGILDVQLVCIDCKMPYAGIAEFEESRLSDVGC